MPTTSEAARTPCQVCKKKTIGSKRHFMFGPPLSLGGGSYLSGKHEIQWF